MKDKYDTTTRDWVDSEEAPEAELDFDATDATDPNDPVNNTESARMLDEWRREFMRIMFDPNYESDNTTLDQKINAAIKGERP